MPPQVLCLTRLGDLSVGDIVMTHPSNTKYTFVIAEKTQEAAGRAALVSSWRLKLRSTTGNDNADYHGTDNDILYTPIALSEFARAETGPAPGETAGTV